MSIQSPTEIRCPECQHTQVVTLWRSLNADVDPEARADLLAGRINVFKCLRCACEGPLSVSLLYHDMTRQFMAQYHPFEWFGDAGFWDDFDERGESIVAARLSADSPGGATGYTSRIRPVFQMSELVRYIIFRERLHELHQSARNPTEPGAAPDPAT